MSGFHFSRIITCCFFFVFCFTFRYSKGQNKIEEVLSQGEIHGNFQTDVQYYTKDTVIGAEEVPEKVLMNGFMNLT